jgi:hypothetical protein
MTKLKFFFINVFMLFMSGSSFAISENSFEVSDLNIDVTVSIEGVENLELAYMNPIAHTPKFDNARFPNLRTKPVTLVHGSTLKLKIETINKSGVKTDVTNDKDVKVVVAGTSVAHVCNKTNLCIWPTKPSEPRNYDPRYETATIQILYFTAGGKFIGINSFDINAIPDPNGRSINWSLAI